MVCRKRVCRRAAKNYQLDLFDPDDCYFVYSAIVTNKGGTRRTLWYLMCRRGTREKVNGKLNGGFTFDYLPTQRFHASSDWQAFGFMASNLRRAMCKPEPRNCAPQIANGELSGRFRPTRPCMGLSTRPVSWSIQPSNHLMLDN